MVIANLLRIIALCSIIVYRSLKGQKLSAHSAAVKSIIEVGGTNKVKRYARGSHVVLGAWGM